MGRADICLGGGLFLGEGIYFGGSDDGRNGVGSEAARDGLPFI